MCGQPQRWVNEVCCRCLLMRIYSCLIIPVRALVFRSTHSAAGGYAKIRDPAEGANTRGVVLLINRFPAGSYATVPFHEEIGKR